MLTDWDAELAADSGEAALFNVWYHYHLIPALIAESKFADEVTRLDTQVVLDLLTTADGQAAALASLNSAWQDTMDRLGDEPDAWRWGDLHQIRFAHPLHHLAAGDLQAAMTIKPYPRGGSANTTNNTGFAPDNFDVRAGASFRMVLDVGNWDAAKMTNAPGQSGDPRSPFYDNLLESWATEGDFPLLFSREAIEAHTVQRILLKPTD
jgi:penicillin amidase